MKNYALVDFRIDKEEELSLLNLGLQVIKCPPHPEVYEAVCGHPDILMHIVDDKKIVLHKDVDPSFMALLKNFNLNILLSSSSLGGQYPFNIKLNAVSLNDFFIHNIKYTDELLIEMTKNKKLINVKQGYTKCSTVIVNDNAIITSDKGIASALRPIGIDALLLPPGDILLPGLDYGFIGGCCGLIDKNRLAFFGNLEHYSYGNEVKDFLYKYDVEPIYLRNGKLVDRGSLFTI